MEFNHVERSSPTEWKQTAAKKTLEEVVRLTPDGESACYVLFSVSHSLHAVVFENDDRQAAALTLAAEFTELAAELAARERAAS